MDELILLPIMARAALVQRERERERESAVDVPVFIVRLLCITYTYNKPGVYGLRHCSTCRFTLVSGRY